MNKYKYSICSIAAVIVQTLLLYNNFNLFFQLTWSITFLFAIKTCLNEYQMRKYF